MDWQDSDPSEDGDAAESQATSRKRSSRACDSCRKTKSKCERGVGDGSPCKSCAIAGTTCTFLGPSYKRGPPKGYIHAIEQRWHQVESLLGVILQCADPRVQSIVADLRQDELAREILNRVDNGPYGPSGRRFQPQGATKEDFFASVLRSNGSTSSGRDNSRSRRQSRVSREKVSLTQDRGLSVVPTQEWQNNLAHSLCSSAPSSSSPYYTRMSPSSDEPAPRRRRLDTAPNDSRGHPDWNEMYTLEALSDHEENDEIVEAIGELSLTENHEIRYHGPASGLQFLSKENHNRIEGGVWNLPMARVWPPSKAVAAFTVQEEDIEVTLPPVHMQDRLIDLFFTYIHPVAPILHKKRFLAEYHARKHGQARENSPASSSSSPKPESAQKVTNLLLLTIFAIAARFIDDEVPQDPVAGMWEAGREYCSQARMILTKIFDRSRPSTVQSLLLLGYRWIYIGMAIRMAIDLGLHRNTDNWKHHGHSLFSRDETQTRRQIWWTCLLADRYGSVYMGRPIVIREGDFDTPLPDLDEEEDQELWQPLPSDAINITYSPAPCHITACQRATGNLFVILGGIIQKLYPIMVTESQRRVFYNNFETQLDQWYLSLPDFLQYDVASKRPIPAPHILFIHVRYWGTVLLLNRAFIPNWRQIDFSSRKSALEQKAFDLAQGAATRISALVTVYRENFPLKRCSPFLTSYVLSTGVMQLLTLSLRPTNVQAANGLRQTLDALEDMSIVWPSASRAKDLLQGVRLGFDASQSEASHVTRSKRHVDDAFGQEERPEYFQRDTFPPGGEAGLQQQHQQQQHQQQQQHHPRPQQQIPRSSGEPGVQDLSTRIMAHMLGLDVPGVEPSTSYYPGYEWWPRHGQGQPGQVMPSSQMPQNPSYSQAPIHTNAHPQPSSDLNVYNGPVAGWAPGGIPDYSYSYNFNQYGL